MQFTWARLKITGLRTDKAAIVVPIGLDGSTCHMQLDTGVGTSILYRPLLPTRYGTVIDGDQLSVERVAMGEQTSAHTFRLMYARTDWNGPHDCGTAGLSLVAGTLGNDIFSSGSLSLDLARARFQYRSGPYDVTHHKGIEAIPLELPEDYEGPGTTAPLVTVDMGDGTTKKMLLDTGSALFDMQIFNREDWLKLVGPVNAKHAQTLNGPRWNASVSCLSAAIAEPVRLGGRKFNHGEMAIYCDDQRGNLVEKFGAFGSIGLMPFQGKVITFDYVARMFIIEPGR